MVYFKVALACGLVVSSPWVFWQIWSFLAAGLYPHEKRSVHVYLPVSLSLFLAGVFLCEFLVIPRAVEWLLWFNEWIDLKPEVRLNEWIGFATLLPVFCGLAFQTPLAMLFLVRIGLIGSDFFRRHRRVAYFVLFVIAALGPGGDALSLIYLAVPMCLLYELGIRLCDWAARPAIPDEDAAGVEV